MKASWLCPRRHYDLVDDVEKMQMEEEDMR